MALSGKRTWALSPPAGGLLCDAMSSVCRTSGSFASGCFPRLGGGGGGVGGLLDMTAEGVSIYATAESMQAETTVDLRKRPAWQVLRQTKV